MAAAGLKPKTIVGGEYRIERPLSSGGMGAVYVATQLSTERERALKVMLGELTGNEDLKRRFIQEAKIGAKIDSEHVVEVVGAGVDESVGPWLAMELLQGEDLASFMDRSGRLEPQLLLQVFEQLAHALGAAHAQQIVHRDLKPENIFLAKPRRTGTPFVVKVLDFGIAKLLDQARSKATGAMGTPLWMAPEQTQSGSRILPACDVWPMGLIAFRALSGVNFWRCASDADISSMMILREVLMDPIPPASERARELGATVPPGFDDWFKRCVTRDPSTRFPEANAAYEGLRAALDAVKVMSATVALSPLGQVFAAPVAGAVVGKSEKAGARRLSGTLMFALIAGVAAVCAVALYFAFRKDEQRGDEPSRPSEHSSAPVKTAIVPAPSTLPSASASVPPPPAAPFMVALGRTHACALKQGSVWCWGGNENGELGFEKTTATQPTARQVQGLDSVVQVATAYSYTCALKKSGSVWCWGENGNSSLGDGTWRDQTSPVEAQGIAGAVQISATGSHACAISTGGSAWCWGYWDDGQLGDGLPSHQLLPSKPSAVKDFTDALEIRAGYRHTCSRKGDGTVWCWGRGAMLGDGGKKDRPSAGQVPNLRATEISAGQEHTCAREPEGAVQCWGLSESGQLGTDNSSDDKDLWGRRVRPQPARVPALADVAELALGDRHSCARKTNGEVLCWGANEFGQLGDGSSTSRWQPSQVSGIGLATHLVSGGNATCAFTRSGEWWCWGLNKSEQIGAQATESCQIETSGKSKEISVRCALKPVRLVVGL